MRVTLALLYNWVSFYNLQNTFSVNQCIEVCLIKSLSKNVLTWKES
jgi:hypothetical protein